MPPRHPDRVHYLRGYVPTMSLVPTPEGVIVDGSNVWVNGGLVYTSRGVAATGSSTGGVASLQTVESTYGGMTVSGSGTKAFGAYWWGGSGNFVVGGSVIGASSGTVTLKAGAYTGAAGLSAPGAPTIADSAVSGKNSGSYSIALTAIRSTTGAESSRGAVSNAIAVKNKKVRITVWPSVPTGANMWGIYCSRRGFSTVGPWYHLADVPTSTAANYDIQWYDGELGALPELDNDPPPSGVSHVFAINSIIVAVVGADLYPSKRAFPEAFSPTSVISIPGGSSVSACKTTGIEGTVLLSTPTSMNLVRDSGVDDAPIQVQQLWPDIGFPNGNCWCVVEDTIYGFHGRQGLIMAPIGGQPQTEWAADVQYKLKQLGWTPANTVLGFDPITNSIMVINGPAFLPVNRATGQWSPPHTLPATITTSVTTSGALQMSSSGGTLYNTESGTGTTYFVRSGWRDGGYAGFSKTLVGLRGHVSATSQIDVYTNLNASSSQLTKSAVVNHGVFHHTNLKADTFSYKYSGSDSGGTELYGIDTLLIPHPVRV